MVHGTWQTHAGTLSRARGGDEFTRWHCAWPWVLPMLKRMIERAQIELINTTYVMVLFFLKSWLFWTLLAIVGIINYVSTNNNTYSAMLYILFSSTHSHPPIVVFHCRTLRALYEYVV